MYNLCLSPALFKHRETSSQSPLPARGGLAYRCSDSWVRFDKGVISLSCWRWRFYFVHEKVLVCPKCKIHHHLCRQQFMSQSVPLCHSLFKLGSFALWGVGDANIENQIHKWINANILTHTVKLNLRPLFLFPMLLSTDNVHQRSENLFFLQNFASLINQFVKKGTLEHRRQKNSKLTLNHWTCEPVKITHIGLALAIDSIEVLENWIVANKKWFLVIFKYKSTQRACLLYKDYYKGSAHTAGRKGQIPCSYICQS